MTTAHIEASVSGICKTETWVQYAPDMLTSFIILHLSHCGIGLFKFINSKKTVKRLNDIYWNANWFWWLKLQGQNRLCYMFSQCKCFIKLHVLWKYQYSTIFLHISVYQVRAVKNTTCYYVYFFIFSILINLYGVGTPAPVWNIANITLWTHNCQKLWWIHLIFSSRICIQVPGGVSS